MRRRDFIRGIVGSATPWPLAARAQHTVWKVGILTAVSRDAFSALNAAFLKGMRELGKIEGKDFVVEWRSVEEHYERYPELIAELIASKVDVIVSASTPAYQALQRATNTIPIVMVYMTDPVGNGFVASLKHPGGNITGLASAANDTAPKQVELLSKIVPNMTRLGLLGNPETSSYSPIRKGVEVVAAKSNLSVVVGEARGPEEINDALQTLRTAGVQAFVAVGDPVFFNHRDRLVQLALRSRLPSMFSQREYAAAGGLMSYGENLSDFYYRAAAFIDKIFKGAKPGDIPVEQPTQFHLVINHKTADALGLSIPSELYIFADEVIE